MRGEEEKERGVLALSAALEAETPRAAKCQLVARSSRQVIGNCTVAKTHRVTCRKDPPARVWAPSPGKLTGTRKLQEAPTSARGEFHILYGCDGRLRCSQQGYISLDCWNGTEAICQERLRNKGHGRMVNETV